MQTDDLNGGGQARRLARGLVAIAAFMLVWQLMMPPVVGLADNGDFGKLLGRFGLGSGEQFRYANTRYTVDQRFAYYSGFHSSELLPIYAALGLNQLLSKDGAFDIRAIGCVHASLFLLALYLFFSLLDTISARARALVGAATLFLFCDVMYVGYFNSFYMDVTAYLFLLFAAVFYLRALRWRRRADSVLLVLSAVVATMSKPQYALAGIWFALLFWVARDVLFRGRRRTAGAAAAAMLLATGVTFRFFAPPSYTAKASFNVVFQFILCHTPNVDRAMADLGLDASYRRWIGTNAYTPGSQLDEPSFYIPYLRRTPYWRIAAYYLKHPAEGYFAYRVTVDEGGRHRVPVGNFDSGTGLPPGAESRSFAWWSNLKRAVFHHHGMRLTFAFGALAAVVSGLLYVNRRTLPRGAMAGGMVLIGMSAMNLVVSALADVIDPTRHLLIFFVQFDMLLLAALWLAARYAAGPRGKAGEAALRASTPDATRGGIQLMAGN